MTVINGTTNEVVTRLPVGHHPAEMAFSGGGEAYVTNTRSDTVSVIQFDPDPPNGFLVEDSVFALVGVLFVGVVVVVARLRSSVECESMGGSRPLKTLG